MKAVTSQNDSRGASLLPENYTDDGTAEATPVPAPESASEPASEPAPVVEAIVVAEPVVEPATTIAPAIVPSDSRTSGRARSLANLRPYKKGQSGNINGRPKGIVSKALTKELKRKTAEGGETVVQALVKGYVAKALEELDPARFNSIRDTVEGRPVSQDDAAGVSVGIVVQLEVVGK